MTEIFNKKTETDKRKILRNNMPQPERILWSKLKNKQLFGYKFRRQYGINRYVVDFYCPILKLAIEIDGDSRFIDYHPNPLLTKEGDKGRFKKSIQEYDKVRQNFIESLGIKILRFTNSNITNNLNSVLEQILEKTTPNPSFVRRGEQPSNQFI